MFSDTLDSFGQRFQAKAIGHAQYRRKHAMLFLVPVDPGDETAVDLQAMDLEASQRGDRGMAGAKVVKIYVAAQLAEFDNVARNDTLRGAGNDGFQHFDAQPFRCQAKTVQFPLDPFDEPGIPQLGIREVHADPGNVETGLVPASQGRQGMLQDNLAQVVHAPRVREDPQKLCRGDDPPFGVNPAGQGLYTRDRTGGCADLRLEPWLNLTVGEGALDLVLEGSLLDMRDPHVLGPRANCRGPIDLRLGKGDLCSFQELLARRVGLEPRTATKADRCGKIPQRLLQRGRFLHRGLQATGDLQERFEVKPYRGAKKNQKAVVAHSYRQIVAAQHAAQAP